MEEPQNHLNSVLLCQSRSDQVPFITTEIEKDLETPLRTKMVIFKTGIILIILRAKWIIGELGLTLTLSDQTHNKYSKWDKRIVKGVGLISILGGPFQFNWAHGQWSLLSKGVGADRGTQGTQSLWLKC